MSILVTGSVAFDHIMVFEDKFKNHILPDQVHILSVSFLVPSLEKRWGGTAGNIAYNLRVLGEDPTVLATAGRDFGPYADWMDECGVRRDAVRVLDDAFTAQCFITTDLDDNQITAFHPGAMDRAHEATVASLGMKASVGIVAPNGKQAMVDHAAALKAAGVPCVVDPGQGLPMFDGDELLSLLDGACLYVVNDYEWALTQDRTGLGEDEIAERVGALIVTRGDQGSIVRRGGRTDTGVHTEAERTELESVKAERVVDPTGCGDAYRAGVLYAIANGHPLEIGAQAGGLLGAMKVALAGPQSIPLDTDAFRRRFAEVIGRELP